MTMQGSPYDVLCCIDKCGNSIFGISTFRGHPFWYLIAPIALNDVHSFHTV